MTHSRIRWWPAAAIVIVGVLALIWIWRLQPELTGQDRVYRTILVTVAGLALFVIWLLLFSRLSRRAVLLTLGALAGLGAFTPAVVRVRGVTGDVLPILEWRWARTSDRTLESLPSAVAIPVPADVTARPTTAAPATKIESEPTARATPVPAPEPAEYPQFLGPDRNGTIGAVSLSRDWTAHPPRLVWKHRVGAGWSGFAVSGGFAVTQEQRGDRELVVAYDLRTGAVRWAHADHERYETIVAGIGPRATPTISSGRVYTLGATGILNALDLHTGAPLWHRNIATDNDAPNPDWGRSGSPLAIDHLIVVSAGGTNGRSLVAYDRESGRPIWTGGSDAVGFSSPLLATLAGLRQILIFNAASVAAHDPETGAMLWDYPWPGGQPNVAQPVILPGDRVLVSSGYGVGSKLLRIERTEQGALHARLLWESPRLKAKFTNLVVHDGFVYGLDDGVLVCLDPETGERRWKGGRYGHGQVLLAGRLLLVQTEEGELVLVEPTPEAHREIARFPVFAEKTWNPPALAGRYLIVRNDIEAACYEMSIDGKTTSEYRR